MRTIATTLVAILAMALGASAFAQGEVPAFCLATDPADPDYDITDFDAQRDADDWCKLAYHQPHKARRQLSKAVSLVRTENNPNRFYWDPRIEPGADYIQLLRPWMAEQGWWIQWPRYASDLYHLNSGIPDSGFTLRYFTADQRNLPASELGPTFTLHLYLIGDGFVPRNFIDAYQYHVYLRGHFGQTEIIYNDDGSRRGSRNGKIAYVTADQNGEPNQYRIALGGEFISASRNRLTARVVTAAVHSVLDCLNPAMIEDWNFEDCEATIEVGD